MTPVRLALILASVASCAAPSYEERERSPRSAPVADGVAGAGGTDSGNARLARTNSPAADSTLVVYKSPSCGCCANWVDHMIDAGFRVEVHDTEEVDDRKREYGVPRELVSCHTARIGGYVIEGHVPADLVSRLLRERPSVTGLAVPGMPAGSPGMEGPPPERYDIVSFGPAGRRTVYATR